MFVNLKLWDDRNRSLAAIIDSLRAPLSGISQARVIPFNSPASRGLGTFAGYQCQLQDPDSCDIDTLALFALLEDQFKKRFGWKGS